MGEDSWYGEISELADKLARGESISGPRGKLAAAYTLYAGRKTRDYELKKMQDNIDELTQGITIATDQHDAAVKRTLAAELAWEAAKQRAQMTSASLDAFDAEFFTPDTWGKMADVMRDIAGNYLYRAIRIAKLMERAYNFENDAELRRDQERVRPGRRLARSRAATSSYWEETAFSRTSSRLRLRRSRRRRVRTAVSRTRSRLLPRSPRSSSSSATPACSRSRPTSTNSTGSIPDSTDSASKPWRWRSSACFLRAD